MPIKTLGGMFSEPKKTCRRNFIRENVHSVSQLQYLLKGVSSMSRSKTSNDFFMEGFQGIDCKRSKNDVCNRSSIQNLKPSFPKKKNAKPIPTQQTFSDRSVQTIESNFDYSGSLPVRKLELDNNISLEMAIDDLKIRDSCTSKMSSQPEHSDDIQSNTNSTEKIENSKSSNKVDNFEAIKMTNKNDREQENYIDPSCPPGYRLLPESERKHTLTTLRQQYFERINELNSLSIRSDTLRIQQKKTEIEKDLKRIDAGIQTFDRPKVFIKKC